MATILTRASKGSPLTNTEVDANFTNLNADKLESTDLSVSTGAASGGGSLSYSAGVFTFAPADLSSYLTDLSAFTTTDLAEGTNLYYTNERVDDRVNALIQAGLGITTSYDDINGELTIESDTIEELCKNGTGSTILKGTPVYQTGTSGNFMEIAPADASSAATMPAVGVLAEDLTADSEGALILMGRISGVDTSAFSEGDIIYVASGGGYTNTRPTGQTVLVQNLGRVTKVNASNGGGVVMGSGRANDVPNLTDGNVFIGNASGTYDKRALVAADITDATVSVTDANLASFVTAFTLPASDGTSGQALVTDGSGTIAFGDVDALPSQTGNDGKYLTTDGTTASWGEVAAGGNSLSFVASGAISAGQAVALQSDGTVTAIASQTLTETSGSPVTFDSSAIAYTATVFDEVNGKIVIFYRDSGNSNYGTAVVGTVSGTSISFGSPSVFVSSAPIYIKATYMSGAGKIGIAYYVGSSIKTIIGTVSGTSISFGTQSDTGATSATVFACAYHASTSSFIVSFRNPSLSNYGQAKAAVVSGTSFSSWGSAISFNSANTQQISMIYDPFRDVSVVCYKDTGGTASLEVVLFTLTSGNPTYISKSFNWNLNLTACGLTPGMAIDSRDNKIIVMGDSYNEIKVTRFQVNADQYNITIDQGTGLATGQYSYYDLSCVYDSNAEKAVLVYSNLSNPRPMKLIVATFPVGTANPSLGSVYSIDTVGATDPSAAFDSSQNKVVVVYEDQTNVNGKATVFQNASNSSNYLDFVGISSASITDTSSGTINLYGSINEAQTGLTVASNYYVQFDGTINTTASSVKIGKALTSTKLLVSGV